MQFNKNVAKSANFIFKIRNMIIITLIILNILIKLIIFYIIFINT